MARRSDHSREELTQIILDASWTIAGTEGFEALTARRLSKEIGYAPGTIYNLFTSMDDLYLHLNAKTLDLLYETLTSPACNNPRKSPPQNMKKMAARYMDFARDHRAYWLMLFNYSLPEHRKDLDWYQDKVERLFEPLEQLMQPYFKDAKKLKMAARILWASVHGLCFLQETGKISVIGSADQTGQMSNYLIDTFIAGINAHN